MFGLVGDVHSAARCDSAVAAALLRCNDARHSCGSLVNQAQTSSSSGLVRYALLPPDFTSPASQYVSLHHYA